MKIANLGFLASYRGTNMQAIIDACKAGRLKARPVVVISNNGSSGALDRAGSEGIPAYHLSSTTFPDPRNLDQLIADTLVKHEAHLVILAGYMKRIGPQTLTAFQGRIINIHPALLPKYGGEGMYGRHVHEAVIAAGDTETGVTIHVVDDKYDHGPILAQRRIPVSPGDTADSLADRVLAVEHAFYIETLEKILSGDIALPH
ncbi:MAG: phosphoribosylglycinamide formyltransferase [Gammaproteobacteria bacterium]